MAGPRVSRAQQPAQIQAARQSGASIAEVEARVLSQVGDLLERAETRLRSQIEDLSRQVTDDTRQQHIVEQVLSEVRETVDRTETRLLSQMADLTRQVTNAPGPQAVADELLRELHETMRSALLDALRGDEAMAALTALHEARERATSIVEEARRYTVRQRQEAAEHILAALTSAGLMAQGYDPASDEG
jgi:hypothetical protein